ncbi:hypothetical protein ABNN70_00260 [Sporolactobacillus sp. Y61]|uniref:ABC transporter permease n=1 Tax=Sporolactobacillus sp. Y61 TaxID=3160863 RepID=A0AAU8IG25_9BACL
MSGLLNRTDRKVAVDIFMLMSGWLIWALSIFVGVFVLSQILPWMDIEFNFNSLTYNFFDGATQAAKYFMLVTGIILASYVPVAYVRHGVTRKNVFKGTFFGITAVALSLSIVVQILYSLVSLIFGSDVGDTSSLSRVFHGQVLFLLLIFLFSCVIYFTIGWLISLAFSRYGFIPGMLSIALSLAVIIAFESLWKATIQLPWIREALMNGIRLPQLPIWAALAGSLVLFSLLLALLQLMMRRMTIKP